MRRVGPPAHGPSATAQRLLFGVLEPIEDLRDMRVRRASSMRPSITGMLMSSSMRSIPASV
jgi:hypothetical protein